MAKEELEETGTPNGTEDTHEEVDSQTGGTPQDKPGETKDVDWQKRYTDLQAKTDREREEFSKRLEALESRSAAQPEEEQDNVYTGDDADDFIDRKTADKLVKDAVRNALAEDRMQRAEAYFRKTYPDVAENEAVISGILSDPKHRSELRKKTPEERIDFAVRKFRSLTDEAVKEARKKGEEEAEEREKNKRQASGLGSSTHTSPAGSEERELSDAEELAERKRAQNKKRGYG